MAQAVSWRSLTTQARVPSQVSACEILGGQSGTGTGFSPEYFLSHLPVSFHEYFVLIFSYELHLTERQKGKAWEPSKKEWSSGNR